MIDRPTKLLLLAIAIGLWLNALLPTEEVWAAQGLANEQVQQLLRRQLNDLNEIRQMVFLIEQGDCRNNDIC